MGERGIYIVVGGRWEKALRERDNRYRETYVHKGERIMAGVGR